MRKTKILLLAMAMVFASRDIRAPLVPPWPEVVNTPDSIRTRVGYMSRSFSVQSAPSNIMAGMYEIESETSHTFTRGKRKGQIQVSSQGALGVGQVMPYHGISMGLDLNDLEENIEASYRVFKIFMAPYLRKYGKDRRTALLYAIQAYYGGPGNANKRYRGWKSTPLKHDSRVYMWKILNLAEGKKIPRKYRFYVFQIEDRLRMGLKI